MARRSRAHEPAREHTIFESSPGLRNVQSFEQCSSSRARHDDKDTTEHDIQAEEIELDVANGQSLIDDDSVLQIFAGDDNQTESQPEEQLPITSKDHANMAPRQAKTAKATQDKQAQKEVKEAFNSLLEDDFSSNNNAR